MKHIEHTGLHRFPFQMIYKQAAKNDYEVFHCHQGLEFYCIHEGAGAIIMDGQRVKARKGMFFIYQPFQMHRIRFENDTNYTRSFFLMEPSVLEEYLKPFPQLFSFLRKLRTSSLPVPFLKDIGERHPLIESMYMLHDRLENLQSSSRERLIETYALTAVMILHILEQVTPKGIPAAQGGSRSPTYSEKAMNWIEEHLDEEIRVDSLARALHLTPNYLSSLFQREVGCSLSDYVTARRISTAKRLLIETDLQVKEITEQLGLKNVSYFCQIFKKQTGITPFQFKKHSLKAYRADR